MSRVMVGTVGPMGLVVVVALAACGAVETDHDAKSYRVGGQVRGLWRGAEGVALRLETDGASTLLTVGNGDFTFDREVARGRSFSVTVASSPAGHSCAIDAGGNGVIADDDASTVSVACTGPVLSIELSGQWGWTFDPTQDAQMFTGSVAAQEVALTVHGASLLGAELAGAAVALGKETAPIRLALGATSLPLALTASGGLSKTYTLMFNRGGALLDQMVYGKASNAGAGDAFACSMALSGDTLAVGAYFENSAASGVNGDQRNDDAIRSGAVYVFVRTGSTWTQQAYLKASNTGAGDNFGRAVALDGDTLVVGAPQEAGAGTGANGDPSDNSVPAAGAVYVFVRTGTAWTQQAYLKASNTGGNYDVFGGALALSGDTLAVGATGESSSATGVGGDQINKRAGTSGAVYVFTRSGSTWTQQAYVKASNTDAGDNFGAAVALSGDTLAVGAPNESSAATRVGGVQSDNSAPVAGAVYVFTRSGTTWSQQSYIKASNTEAQDLFGNALALSGDTLAVGAYGEDSAATGIDGDQADNRAGANGAVYVFVRVSGTWTQQAYVKASNAGRGYAFGTSLALSGDVLVVGGAGESSGATGIGGNQTDGTAPAAGAAYLFTRSGTAWAQTSYVKASNTGSDDAFGFVVALSADTLVIAAPGESSTASGINPATGQADNTGSGAGAVYVFR